MSARHLRTKRLAAASSDSALGAPRDMPTGDRVFHAFSRLPTELREAIWRECLPNRVCELDYPAAELLYGVENAADAPCTLRHTSILNELPPLITRVCRESRSVAFQAGKEAVTRSKQQKPPGMTDDSLLWVWPADNQLRIPNGPTNGWLDRVADIVHMSWTFEYDYPYGGSGSMELDVESVEWLATWASHSAAGRASIMVDRLTGCFTWEGSWRARFDEYPDSDIDIEAPPEPRTPDTIDELYISAFKLLPGYLVVLQVVVIHMDTIAGAESGLFGTLGDAPVQIIDMTDEASIDHYFALAIKCESAGDVSKAQDLKRRTLQVARERLRIYILNMYGNEELVSRMEPAIMFRLCSRMCNHLSQTAAKMIVH